MRSGGRIAYATELILAALTLLLAALLIIQCIGLYAAGVAPENLTETGVRIADAFSRELVLERLKSISWAFWAWLTALIAAVVCRLIYPKKPALPPVEKAYDAAPKPARCKKRILQISLATAAAALIVAGILNGGMYDVLVKAINICTECIGLG